MSKNKVAIEAVALALVQKQLEEQNAVAVPYENALGKLSIRFSLLHSTLEHFSWKVWGLEGHLAPIVTKDLRTTHLIQKLCVSVEKSGLSDGDAASLKAVLKKAKKLAEKRNDLLHSLWIIRNGEPVLCFSRNRGRLVGPDAPSVEYINALSSQVMDILAELFKFEERHSTRNLFALGLGLLGNKA